MLIMGIDPGLAIVGYGVIQSDGYRCKAVRYGVIRTPAGMPLESRLLEISNDMNELLRTFKPDSVAMEQLFFNTNRTTGIQVAQARGVTLLECARFGVKIYEYTPLQVKMAVTGYGKAEKLQVMDMTKRILELDSTPRPDDAADALAVAICHAHSGG